jgi:hypothetical protein
VVSCGLPDTDAPLMFVTGDDLIIDVSCDEGMGFGWARPASFAEPMERDLRMSALRESRTA